MYKSILLLGAASLALTAAAQEPTNVLLGKSVIEVAGNPAAEDEGPDKLIDGDRSTKYCIIQSNPYVVIDAKGYYTFSSFKFHDCQTNEQEENASAYKLEVSMDGKTWTVAAEASNVADVALKEIALTAPVKARYVKFSPTYNNCARMWELEGFGIDSSTLSATLHTESLELDVNASGEIKVGYTVKGEKGADFACTALSEKSNVEVGTPVEANGVFTIPVKGISKGNVKVVVKIVNNGEIASFEVPIKVKSDAPASDADAIAITNWKYDMVAENLTKDAFNGISQGWGDRAVAFYTSAVSDEGAICDEDGIIEVPTSGNVYKIPFGANNAFQVTRNDDPVEINFAEVVPTEQVNILAFADTEDNDLMLHAVLKYEDGSESDETSQVVGPFKYDVVDGLEAVTDLGMVEVDLYTNSVSILPNRNYRLYEISIPADQYKNVKSVAFTADGGSYKDYIYVIGVNAHNVNGVVTKHLNAEIAEKQIKVKQDATANIVVNYTLTDVEGLTDELTFSAAASKDAITLGEIAHDKEAKTLTIPVTGVTPSIATVDVNLAFGTQTLKLVAQVLVKSTVVADETNCIAISNWVNDVIAEAAPAGNYANQKLDDQGWVFFTDDIHPEGAIAGDERLVVTASENVYKLAPYNGANGTVIIGVGGYDVSHNLDFATPIYTEKINLLGTSANGQAELDITVIYEDGSKSDVQSATVADWHSAAPEGTEAVYGLGRVNITSNDIAGERNFRLFEIPVVAQRAQKVKSVNINNKTALTYFTVLGVNAKDEKSSGINSINTDNGEKVIVAYYNLQGQQVENASNGLYIVRYADGTSAKLFVK